jgi:periplasmic divalent cation tolerance protein
MIVFSTCASKREAKRIAGELVKRKHAACVNILPISSVFRWEGMIHREAEWLMLIKTRSEALRKLKTCILALHGCEVPEIIALRIADGLPSYLAWIDKEASSDSQ